MVSSLKSQPPGTSPIQGLGLGHPPYGPGPGPDQKGVFVDSSGLPAVIDDDDEDHDSFEFGDPAHAKQPWGRRAFSMTYGGYGSGAGAGAGEKPSGIAAILKGFGSGARGTEQADGQAQPTVQSPTSATYATLPRTDAVAAGPAFSSNSIESTMPPLARSVSGSWSGHASVMADKAAKGQGVLRRLSMTGAGGGFKVSRAPLL